MQIYVEIWRNAYAHKSIKHVLHKVCADIMEDTQPQQICLICKQSIDSIHDQGIKVFETTHKAEALAMCGQFYDAVLCWIWTHVKMNHEKKALEQSK